MARLEIVSLGRLSKWAPNENGRQGLLSGILFQSIHTLGRWAAEIEWRKREEKALVYYSQGGIDQ